MWRQRQCCSTVCNMQNVLYFFLSLLCFFPAFYSPSNRIFHSKPHTISCIKQQLDTTNAHLFFFLYVCASECIFFAFRFCLIEYAILILLEQVRMNMFAQLKMVYMFIKWILYSRKSRTRQQVIECYRLTSYLNCTYDVDAVNICTGFKTFWHYQTHSHTYTSGNRKINMSPFIAIS